MTETPTHTPLPCPAEVEANHSMAIAFWSKVMMSKDCECWIWQGAKNAKGYGNFRSKSAHVVAYEISRGPIGKGMTIDHLCSVRACVNPNHLEAVTLQENIRRHVAKITHCKHGHPLSGDNVRFSYREDGTHRKCRLCDRNRQRLKRQRNAA